MASHQQRTITIDSKTNNENMRNARVKAVAAPIARPLVRNILGEVGNQVNKQLPQKRDAALKPSLIKPSLIKPAVAAPIKKETAAAKNNDLVKDGKVNVIKKIVDVKPRRAVNGEQTRKVAVTKGITRPQQVSPKKEVKADNLDTAYSSSALFVGIDKVDELDKNNPLAVCEYIMDIYAYLRRVEEQYTIRQHFMKEHRSTPRMRTILISWIVELHENFSFCLETLHLSVSIIDRYLQINPNVGRETLQLVGASSCFVAAKFEEMYTPDIKDYVYICDNTFTKNQILKMEQEILSKLGFMFGRPYSLQFLRRYNKIACVQQEQHALSKYLLEIMLAEYELCHLAPSLQAAAACCLSLAVTNEVGDPASVWSPLLIRHSGYKYSQFKSVVVQLASCLKNIQRSRYTIIAKKYAKCKHLKVSCSSKLYGPLINKLSAMTP